MKFTFSELIVHSFLINFLTWSTYAGCFSNWSISKEARVWLIWKGLQNASQDHWPDTRKISSFDQRTELQAFLIRRCRTTAAKGRESLENPADQQHSPSKFLCAGPPIINHHEEEKNSIQGRGPCLHSQSPRDMDVGTLLERSDAYFSILYKWPTTVVLQGVK